MVKHYFQLLVHRIANVRIVPGNNPKEAKTYTASHLLRCSETCLFNHAYLQTKERNTLVSMTVLHRFGPPGAQHMFNKSGGKA